MTDTLTTQSATPSAPEPPRHVQGGPRASLSTLWLPWSLAMLSAVLVLLDVSAPVLRPLAGLYLGVGVPTWVLARRLRWSFDTAVHAWVISFGLTVLGIIAGGLALNVGLPRAGIDRPLSQGPLSVVVVAVALVMLAWRPRVALLESSPGVLLERLGALQWRLVPALALLNVVLAVVGAVRLNNDAGSTVAVLGHVGVAVLLGAVMFSRTEDLRRDTVAVLGVGLSLLLATSLRGWYISGHDVQREYISFQLTHNAGRWAMSDYPTAYHACLSVNILPTVLSVLTGLSGPVVFKVVLQVLAAVVPVVVFLLARSIVDRRLALAATAVFVGFPTFATDLPYLVRQEVAFLFLGMAFLAASQLGFSIRHRRVLVAVMGVGVVFSHYSTTYVMIATLVFGLGALFGLRWWEDRRARGDGDVPVHDRETLVVLHPGVLVALVVATFLWVSPITHSGGHLLDTAGDSISGLLGGTKETGSSDLGYSIIPGQKTSDAQRLDDFAAAAIKARDDNPDAQFLLPVTKSMEHPTSVTMKPDPLTGFGSVLDRALPVATVNGLLRTGLAFALQVLLLVGLGALVLRRARGVPGLPDQTRAVMVGALGGIGMVVLVPGLSAEYGVLRAFQQGFVLLAPVVVVGAVTLVGAIRPLASRAVALVQAGAVFLVLVLTGVVSTVTGGYTGVLALSNTGPYHEIHYVTAPEVAGYRWLGQNAGGRIVQAEVISDKLAANRLVDNPSAVLVASDMYPASLLSQSAVFLGPDTVHDGFAAEFYTGALLTYRYPTARVERHLDLVFSSPDARIYWPGPGR